MALLSLRRLALPILIALLVTLLTAPPATASTASSSAASTSTSLVNQARSDRGIAQLSVSGELNRIATAWSHQMAKDGRLYHNPDLAAQTGPASWRAENVGMHPGPVDVDAAVRRIHDKFMSSSGHRANILESRVHEVGVGVVKDAGGTVWITQVFRSRSSSGGSSGTPTAPKPSEPAPKPTAPAPSEPAPRAPAPAPTTTEPSPPTTPADETAPPSPDPTQNDGESGSSPDAAPTHRAVTAPRLAPEQLEDLKTVRAASDAVAEAHVLSGQSDDLVAEHPWLLTFALVVLALSSAATLTAARSG